jgi:hypothetical protein
MLDRCGAWRFVAVLVAGFICSIAVAGPSLGQTDDGTAALNSEMERLHRASKYAEATEVAKQMLAILALEGHQYRPQIELAHAISALTCRATSACVPNQTSVRLFMCAINSSKMNIRER